jgi:hypothetical protein
MTPPRVQKLSSVQPDLVEEPDAVDDTPSGRFCSSSTVDEPDDVDNTSSGRNYALAVDDTPSGRFCSSSTVDTSSRSMPLLREELLIEEVCPTERERVEKGKRKKKERENMVV